MVQVVILIPGIMGSVLENKAGEVIWPGPIESLILPFARMDDLMLDDLVATDCIRSYAIAKQYQSLIDDLAGWGFTERSGQLVICAYDWRKNCALSAVTLADHVDAAADQHHGDCQITLLAHSMGGLVSRHYLESGRFSDRPGFGNVVNLLTMGTPHRGASIALPLVRGVERQLFLAPDQVKRAASDPLFPGPYQLLPPPGEPFLWDDTGATSYLPLDPYDPAVASALGLVVQNLDAARAFHATLDYAKRPKDVRYFCFTGTQQATVNHVLRRASAPEVFGVAETDGGDGTVPSWSAALHGVQRLFVSGSHGTIYQSREIRRAIPALLGLSTTLAGVPEKVEVILREPVVEPGQPVDLTISFPDPIMQFSGVLSVERAALDSNMPLNEYAADPKPQTITYDGAGLTALSIRLEAPGFAGIYRVALRDEIETRPSGSGALIVQRSG
jgi:pimeloyl-ACP methyl ester carboxylesterase